MYICEICKKQIKSSCALSKHIHSKHKLLPQQYYDMFYKKDNEGICLTCGKNTPFLKISKGYQRHCSAKCAQNDLQVDNIFRNNNPQKNSAIREKTNQTCQIKYGGNSSLCDKIVKEKSKQTMINKFGVENIYQLPEIQLKARINSHTQGANMKREQMKRENVRKLAKEIDAIYVQDLLDMTKSSGWYQIGIVNTIKYKNHIFVSNADIQTVLDYDNNSYKVYSINEKKIVSAIQEIYNGKIIENSKKIISPKELDIFLPDLNLAIEYNGIYFHSSLTNTPKDYHLKKSLLCKEKGIRLIHIYEFENLITQIELLKSLILGVDKYPKTDFNKNNFLLNIPEPIIIYDDGRLVVYGAGELK